MRWLVVEVEKQVELDVALFGLETTKCLEGAIQFHVPEMDEPIIKSNLATEGATSTVFRSDIQVS